MSILYEITGFQADSHNLSFWDGYGDIEGLGAENPARRDDKTQKNNIQPQTSNSESIIVEPPSISITNTPA